MIVIKEKNFEMVHTHGPFFDLSALVTINAGKETERQEMQVIAHGMPFDECMKRLIITQLDQNKTYTLKEYIAAYDLATKQIFNLMKDDEVNNTNVK